MAKKKTCKNQIPTLTPRAVPPGGTLQESTRPKEYHQEGAPLGGAPLGVYSLEGYTLGGTHWGTPLGGTPQGVSPWGYSPRGTPWVVTPGDHPRRVPPQILSPSYHIPINNHPIKIQSTSNQYPIHCPIKALSTSYELPINNPIKHPVRIPSTSYPSHIQTQIHIYALSKS